MNILYSYLKSKKNTPKKYVFENQNIQQVLLIFEDQGDTFVFYSDDITKTVHLNKIKNINIKPIFKLCSIENFEELSQQEFDYYYNFIHNNYNYQGIHKGVDLDV